MVGGEVKRVGFNFFFCECYLLIDEELDGVQPVSVIPYVEVLLVFQQQNSAQLFLGFYDRWNHLEQRNHQPLSVAPDCVGLRV